MWSSLGHLLLSAQPLYSVALVFPRCHILAVEVAEAEDADEDADEGVAALAAFMMNEGCMFVV